MSNHLANVVADFRALARAAEPWPDSDPMAQLARHATFAIQSGQNGAARELGEKHFQEIIDALPAAIYTTDADGLLTHFNLACATFSGRTPVLGSDHWCVTWRLYYPDGTPMPHDECPMAIALKGGVTPRGVEAIAERPDGTRIWFEPFPTPLRDAAGKIIGGINMLVDVTARKKVEHELRETQEQYRRLVSLLPAAVYTCEAPSGRITFFNEQAAMLWCRAPQCDSTDDLFCGSFRLWRPDGTRLPHDQTPMAQALREGRFFRNAEVGIERPDGSRITVLVNIDPVRSPDGRIIGAINTFHDISALKRAETAVRESEERYRSLVSVITDVPWTTDASGAFVIDQPAWSAYTGQTFEELRGFNWVNALHPDCRESILKDWTHACATHTLYKSQGLLWHAASGQYRHFEVRGTPLMNPDGSVREWVGTCTDVHEQKQSQEQLREINRRKDEFLAMLSHELRNPLAPIMSAVRVLRLHERSGAENLAQERAREIIERQVGNLTRLVNELLEVSRVITGRARLRPESVDVRLVVEHSLEAVQPFLKRRRLCVTAKLGSQPICLIGDPVRLQQILVNILNNAGKYTDEDGSIEVTLEQEGDQAVIRVKDTGIGIAADLLPRIFDLFSQGHRTLDRSQGGLGIGLSLVKHLVELHRGTVEAHSAGPGLGSEFCVRLPIETKIAATPEEPKAQPQATDASPERLRVLVVDDNIDLCKMLTALLQHSGHSVQKAHDGLQAIQAALSWRPDVVLLDIGLPTMDGYEVARRLREDPVVSDMRLVAITGYGQEEDVKAAYAAGFDAHLTKPVDYDDLTKLFATWTCGTHQAC